MNSRRRFLQSLAIGGIGAVTLESLGGRAFAAASAQKAIALAIGLNSVDKNHYGGWAGELFACENDAHTMAAIASGFQTTTLLTKEATRAAVLAAIRDAAAKLKSGDIFMISYSGHGGQILDENGDEWKVQYGDNLDETWCLYDGQMIDDELYTEWGKFAAGVRILVFSDSCHSGTVAKLLAADKAFARSTASRGGENAIVAGDQVWDFWNGNRGEPATAIQIGREPAKNQFGSDDDAIKLKAALMGDVPSRAAVNIQPRYRYMPPPVAIETFRANRAFYEPILRATNSGDSETVKASGLLISGCQDNQLSLDGWENGKFTGALKAVWSRGFQGTYQGFSDAIATEMRTPEQTPNFFTFGTKSDFYSQQPFSV